MKDKVFLYRFLRPIINFLFKLGFRPKYEGLENIPMEGRVILAGTHTSILDCFYLISSTKRSIHFLAKKELWDGPKKILFGHMGLIPVDRSKKDHNSLEMAEKYLNNDCMIGIFPEGTTEKKRGLLPFKIGAVKMAYDTKSPIVPFVILGKYKPFKKGITIKFLKPIQVNTPLEDANDKLRNIIKKEIDNYENANCL